MKVTAEQIKKWNAACSNGWAFDSQNNSNEKRLVKYVSLDNESELRAILFYDEKEDGTFTPNLHLSKWYFYCSSGLGKFIDVEKPQTKRRFSVLQKLTANYPENVLLDLANEHNVQLNNPNILGK